MAVQQSAVDTVSMPITQAASSAGGQPQPCHKAAVIKGDGPPSSTRRDPETTRILRLSVPVSVTLAERDLSVESILQITVGTILEFETAFDAELTLMVGNRAIGRGQAVKVGENFGLRITRIESLGDRIDALGG